jgi:HTH-type transcriptional regulator, sugar sensing transcriptional regulator
MVVNIVQELAALGFTEYEAKAYTALLRANTPLTAYEIAKASGIPTSKIYEVTGKLAERNVFYPLETSGTKKYEASDPSEMLAEHRLKTEASLSRISKGLASLRHDTNRNTIFNLSEYDVLIDKAIRMITGAKKEILLSVWNEEFRIFIPHLKNAKKRKVKIAVVHFGETEETTGHIFMHPIADTLYSEKGGRGLAIVCDGQEALIGTIHDNETVDGGISANTGFVTITEDYIKHDVYIMKIVNRFNSELVNRFGENYALLRDIFTDKEVLK